MCQAEAKLEAKHAEFDKLKENTLQLFVDVNADNFTEIHEVSAHARERMSCGVDMSALYLLCARSSF